MDVPGLCVSLLLVLLSGQDQKFAVSGSVFLRVEPNRLQFFEYERVLFHCEGLNGSTGLKIHHRILGKLAYCVDTKFGSSVTSCTLPSVYQEDSGEYWCESDEGEKSNSIKIAVTAGSVVLESPALPVLEGEAVTLRCTNKTPSDHIADFYKNGRLISSSTTGQMTIHRVSECDSGLYRCEISGGGESAESWLAVKDRVETCSSCSSSSPACVVISVLLALLLVVGLRHLGKGFWHRGLISLLSLKLRPSAAQTVSVEPAVAREDKETYAVVSKKQKKEENHDVTSGALYYTLDDAANAGRPDPEVYNMATVTVHSPGPSQPLTQDSFYSTIQKVTE